ncbi:hypothetical protein [Conexibacter arvalis]|uniref:Peptidase M10 metallopeptidase domain-containing protein n=1 Tax=Conexibacter arvalis TaxID=912552 RepID=A0A840IJF4_9ACTN|nr:hypothetical protein [Conexibacter arvalis]MBB4664465.1 hypothetical protein [Conexibacter arvalis]
MKRALVGALAVALLLGVAAAAPAAAGTFQGSIAISSIGTQGDPSDPIAIGAVATVVQQCDPGTPCAWLPFVTTVPAARQCSPAVTASTWVGDAYGQTAGQQPQTFSPTWRERPSQAAGARRACLYVRTAGGDSLVAESAFTVPPAIVLPPGAGVPRAPIPRAIGVRRGFGYRLSLASIPRGVDRTRFSLLARAAAKRWGLRLAGRTNRVVRSGDRVDSVGFAPGVPSYALGVTTIRSVRWFRRVDGRPRVVRQQVVERDTRLAVGAPWHAGPGRTPPDRIDLQTVIIHELGHYAGNDHVRNCTNSPMWVALRPGEWWHDRRNWFQHGCGSQARAARGNGSAAAGRARPMLHEHVYRDVLLD